MTHSKTGPGVWRKSSQKKERMAKNYLNKCSSFVVIRKIELKTTLRFHITTVRIAKVKEVWQGIDL